MGEHSAPRSAFRVKVQGVARWVARNRGKLAASALVALPLVSRLVPGFPTDEAVQVLRLLIGAG